MKLFESSRWFGAFKPSADNGATAVTDLAGTEIRPLPIGDNGRHRERAKGLEPSTSSLGSNGPAVVSDATKRLTPMPPAACTNACTSEPKTAHAELLESLAAALRGSFSTDECRRLAGLLTGEQSEGNA